MSIVVRHGSQNFCAAADVEQLIQPSGGTIKPGILKGWEKVACPRSNCAALAIFGE